MLRYANALNRSSCSEVFCKIGVLRNFAKFTGKYLCLSLFLDKVTGLRPATLLKERLWHRCFPVNFTKFLKTLFFMEHLRWLPLFKFNETQPIHVYKRYALKKKSVACY